MFLFFKKMPNSRSFEFTLHTNVQKSRAYMFSSEVCALKNSQIFYREAQSLD
jgi:hypothetical protein